MFVTEKEPSFQRPHNLKLRIINQEGKEWILDVTNDFKIDKLKVMCVHHFYNLDPMKTSIYYNIICVRLGQRLKDEQTVIQSGLFDQDELLLVKRPLLSPPKCLFEKRTSESASSSGSNSVIERPDFESIERATSQLATRNQDRRVEASTPEVRFTRELQPILVSLIDAAQKVLCLSTDAANIFQQVQEQLSETRAAYPDPDEVCVVQLVEMGFQRSRGIKALRLNNNILSDATEWIIAHESDDSIDDELVDPTPTPLQQALPRLDDESGQGHQFVEPMSPQLTLELFRAYNRRQFRPNERARLHLMEMGFDEAAVVDSLRLFSNDEGQALDHLLSPERNDSTSENLVGLPTDSPLWKAIMADPIIQLGLTYPTSLFAFLNILDNPGSTMEWLSNQEIGPMLYQVSRLFYSELSAVPEPLEAIV